MPVFLELWSGCLSLSQQHGTSPCSSRVTGNVAQRQSVFHTTESECEFPYLSRKRGNVFVTAATGQ